MIPTIRPILLSLLFLPAIGQASLTASITYVRNTACGNAGGEMEVTAYGGVPPYTYLWSPEPAFGQGMYAIGGVSAGAYSVLVTDNLGATVTTGATIGDDPYVTMEVYNGSVHACPGMCNGWVSVWAVNGTMPYGWSLMPVETQGANLAQFEGGWCDGQVATISLTDANGCPGSGGITVNSPNSSPMEVTDINGACNGANGSALFHTNGDAYSLFGCYVQVTDPGNTVIYTNNITGAPYDVPLQDLAPGTYTATRQWPSGNGCPIESLEFTIPDLSGSCGTIQGNVFLDHDQDCAQDANDENIAYRVLRILPGPEYAITNADGSYLRNLDPGVYTLDQSASPDLWQLCPVDDPIPFTITNNGGSVQDLADSSLVPLDLDVWMTGSTPRPGFTQTIVARVSNTSGQLSAPLDVAFTFDPLFSVVSVSPAPTNVSGNVITWSGLAPPLPYNLRLFDIVLQLPPDAGLIGTTVNHDLQVSQAFPESSSTNNTYHIDPVVSGSYDPNRKDARTSTGWSDELFVIGEDAYIDYTIQFQNTGTDTAFTVVVTDTISAALDLATFQQGVASHPFSVAFKQGRVVEWTFNNILLPDSGKNEALSHGLVGFRIEPVLPLLPGTEISNAANIYFDFNEPVITGPSVLTAEFSTGQGQEQAQGQGRSGLFPNPATDKLTITMSNGQLLPSQVDVTAADGRITRLLNGRDGTFDVRSLAPGAYAVRANGLLGRFVKQ